MAAKKTSIYLITVPEKETEKSIKNILSSGVLVEFLNPQNLGEEWKDVSFSKSSNKVDNRKNLDLLDDVLEFYKPKGFFSGLLDARVKTDLSDIEKALKNRKKITNLAEELFGYKMIEAQLKEAQDKKIRKELDQQITEADKKIQTFAKKVEDAISENDKNEIENLQVDLEKLALEKEVLEAKTVKVLAKRLSEKREAIKETGVDPDNLSKKAKRSMAALHAGLEIEENLEEAKKYIFSTKAGGKVNFLFVAVNSKDAVVLEETLKHADLAYENTGWNEEIVSWESKGNLKSFQGVAEGLGTIGRKEFDPTVLVAVFFMLFFAFCLGDALYGLMIALFTGYFLFFKNLKPGVKSFFGLFFFSSLATLVFGMFTNSWGGNLFADLPVIGDFFAENSIIDLGLDKDHQNPGAWINSDVLPADGPLNNPVVFMLVLAGAIGFIHLIIGLTLKVVNARNEGEKRLMLDSLSWLMFILSAVSYLAVSSLAPEYAIIPMVLAAVSLLGLFIFNEGTGIFGKFFKGLVKIYELISVAADTISYTRLVATGLTSAIIAIVVNMLAFMMIDAGGVMIAVGIVVLIGGHVFNLAVAAFGAYINPLRLHYVEFMPKFYEARGRRLEPQIAALKHVDLAGSKT